jgi:hypothetical protein
MRPKASILILLTFARLMVLGFVALACPGVDYMRLWQETLDQNSHSNTGIIASRRVAAPESLSSVQEAFGVTPEATDTALAGLSSAEAFALFTKVGA